MNLPDNHIYQAGKSSEPAVEISWELVDERTKLILRVFVAVGILSLLIPATMMISESHFVLVTNIIMGLMFSGFAFVFATTVFSNFNKRAILKISHEALEFSDNCTLSLMGRNKRAWSDVHSVQIFYPEAASKSNAPHFRGEKLSGSFFAFNAGPHVAIDFSSGGSASIPLSFLTRLQAEELFSAVEKFGDISRFSGDFVKMQKAIILERLDSNSFTQIWAESLSPKFSATNYVPLSTGSELQDGRYRVLMELAAGGMSAVYLAKADGVKVVLKESSLPHDIDQAQQAKARELFEREAKLLLKLKHPQIARVLDRFVEEERDYLVLEYIPGNTLNQLVGARGKQAEKEVRNWASQLTNILIYLHSQEPPLLHRDLTPDNVVLKDNGEIILIDFGAANEFVGKATGTMIGKQCYIAPEQLRGKATQQSDIYALGGTINFLLTGEDPEPLSCSRPRQSNADVSVDLDQLVASMTAFELEDRLKSASSVLELLERPGTNEKR